MQNYDEPGFVNIGVGYDISIYDLALMIKEIVGFEGEIERDLSKPDGTPRKLLDVSRITALGWTPRVHLRDGIASTCRWFVQHRAEARL